MYLVNRTVKRLRPILCPTYNDAVRWCKDNGRPGLIKTITRASVLHCPRYDFDSVNNADAQ